MKEEFESMSIRETDTLDDFCMKLNGVVTNIRILGDKMEEAHVVKKILCAVPSKFSLIASTIEQFGDIHEMTVDEVVG